MKICDFVVSRTLEGQSRRSGGIESIFQQRAASNRVLDRIPQGREQSPQKEQGRGIQRAKKRKR